MERQTDRLTFTLVVGVGSQSVAVETLLAAVTEEAVGVVDALQTLSGLTVAVADGVGVDVVVALTGPAGSDRTALTQRVPEETVVAELAAFTCRQVTAEDWFVCQRIRTRTQQGRALYLWFQWDSWCRPPLWFWTPRRRWLRPDTDTARSRPPCPGWRRRRNRPYSARSSARRCRADSHRLLGDKQSVSVRGSEPVQPGSPVGYLCRGRRPRCGRDSCRARRG